jgi:hypothetical protein
VTGVQRTPLLEARLKATAAAYAEIEAELPGLKLTSARIDAFRAARQAAEDEIRAALATPERSLAHAEELALAAARKAIRVGLVEREETR